MHQAFLGRISFWWISIYGDASWRWSVARIYVFVTPMITGLIDLFSVLSATLSLSLSLSLDMPLSISSVLIVFALWWQVIYRLRNVATGTDGIDKNVETGVDTSTQTETRNNDTNHDHHHHYHHHHKNLANLQRSTEWDDKSSAADYIDRAIEQVSHDYCHSSLYVPICPHAPIQPQLATT